MSNVPGAVLLIASGLKSKSMNLYLKRFDSLLALSGFISLTPVNGYFARHNSNVCGRGNYAENNNLMLNGWQDGARRVSAVMASGPVGSAPVRRVVNSVVGFAPNVPAAIAGRPKNMRRAVKVNQPRRVVSIFYNSSVGCNISGSDIEKASAKLFNVVAGLERSGVRVELWTGDVSKSTDKKSISGIAVKLKSAEQPLNILKMCYPIFNPNFQRCQIFAMQERMKLTGNWRSFGYACNDPEIQKNALLKMGVNATNIFNYYTLNGKTEEEIINMIK